MSKVVLMYHDIYIHDTSESGFQNSTALKYKVARDKFEKQVSFIDDYLRTNKLPADAVEFTFDDGGESFLTVAAPILEKYGFRGIFFITTGYIGTKGFLNVEQIKELVKRGHTVGSHSHSHPERMCVLSKNDISEEWEVSQMLLTEILLQKSTVASIPNGYSSKDVLYSMVDAGINTIYTSDPTTKHKKVENAEIIGRYVVTDDDSLETVKSVVISEKVRLLKYLRFKSLGIAKTLLGDFYLTIRNKLTK